MDPIQVLAPALSSRGRSARHTVVSLALTAVIAVALSAVSGCGGGEPTRPGPIGEVMPNFLLRDVNPNSTSYNQAISPREYRGRVSAYYFGAAT